MEDGVVSGGAPPLHGIQFGLAEQPQVAGAFPDQNGEQAGLGIRRLTFDARLADAVPHHSLIQFHPKTEARDVRTDPNGIATVITADGEVGARFIALADGLRSAFRHRLGWTVGPRPPHRYCLSAHWTMDGPVGPGLGMPFD